MKQPKRGEKVHERQVVKRVVKNLFASMTYTVERKVRARRVEEKKKKWNVNQQKIEKKRKKERATKVYWNQEEHQIFLKYRIEYDRNWKMFATKFTTRTAQQIFNYADRYYSKNEAAAKERKREESAKEEKKKKIKKDEEEKKKIIKKDEKKKKKKKIKKDEEKKKEIIEKDEEKKKKKIKKDEE